MRRCAVRCRPLQPSKAFAPRRAMLQPAGADDAEAAQLFGFTAGSDIGDDREIEMETTARVGKTAGSYRALFETFEARSTPVKNLRVGPTLTFSRHATTSVATLS